MTVDELREYKRKWAAERRANMTIEELARLKEQHQRSYEKHREKRLREARMWKTQNKQRCVESRKNYYALNRKKEACQTKLWHANNYDRVCELRKNWAQKHHDTLLARRRTPEYRLGRNARERNRYANDLHYMLEKRMRARMWAALRVASTRKIATTIQLLGCTGAELKKYLEDRFLPGMSWELRKEIHIDHIVPIRRFDLSDPAQQHACFHYTNLQPLWKQQNLLKGSK